MSIDHSASRELSSVAATTWIRLDSTVNPFSVTATVALSAGAVLTYTVEYTNASLLDENDTGVPMDLPEMVDLTASEGKAIVSPVHGVRLNVTAWTSGTATLIARQSGVGIYD